MRGINKTGDILDNAVELEIINKVGAYYTIDEKSIQGRLKAKQYLLDNPKTSDKIEAQIRQQL